LNIKSKSEPRNVSKQAGAKNATKSSPERTISSPRSSSLNGSSDSADSRSHSRERVVPDYGTPARPFSSNTNPAKIITDSSDYNTSLQVQRRKKAHNRQILFAGLSQPDKEKIDHAIRILDKQLYNLWHKKRYAKRLRALLEFEGPYRSKLLLCKAKSIFAIIQRENKAHLPMFQVDSEWFHLHYSGSLLWSKMYPIDNTLQSLESYETQNNLQIDMIQCFVQSIVLSSRSKDFLRVIQYSKELWNVLCYLLYVGKLLNSYWYQMLWRGMIVVGQSIMDSLKGMKYMKLGKSNHFLKTKIIPVNSIPVEDIFQLYNFKVMGVWIDQDMVNQVHEIDLPFCSEMLLFVLEMLYVADKHHRFKAFSKEVLLLFNNIHKPIIANLLERIEEQNSASKTVKTIIQLRTDARHLISLSIFQPAGRTQRFTPADIQKRIVNLLEEAISLANASNDPFLESNLIFELANYLYDSGKIDGAVVNWSRATDCLLGHRDSIKDILCVTLLDWKGVNDSKVMKNLEKKTFGVIGNMIFIQLIIQLCRFAYQGNYDKQSQLVWVAAELVYLTFTSQLGNPTSYIEYQKFSADSFLQKHCLFKDKFILNPTLVLSNFNYLATQLIEREHPAMAFPILSLTESITRNILFSITQNNVVSILKVEALAKSGLIKEASDLLFHCSKRLTFKKKFEEEIVFENDRFPLDQFNLRAIKSIIAIGMIEKLKVLLAMDVSLKFELAKVKIVVEVLKLQYPYQITSFGDSENINEFECAMVDLCSDLRAIIWKLITPLQLIIRKEHASACTDSFVTSICLLIECIGLLSQVCYMQRNYKGSLLW
jgi:phosphoribosyl-ATP pyrophosphohydrolase